MQVYDNVEEANDARLFVKWLSHWRTAVLCWAVFSADLAHQADDYLMNHSCVCYLPCFSYSTEYNRFILVLDKKPTPFGTDISPKSSFTVCPADVVPT
jgi:hypothetical protein